MKHVPQDVRRTETKKKIVEAAKLLFSQSSYLKITSKDIAKAANVSIGSFYTYFNNKKEVLIEILNSYINNALTHNMEFEDKISQNVSEITNSLKCLINKCFEMHNFSVGFYRNVITLSTSDEEIGLIFKEYEETIINKIKEFLLRYGPSIPSTQLNVASIIVYSAVRGSIHNLQFHETDLDETILINELVRFINAYILSLNLSTNTIS